MCPGKRMPYDNESIKTDSEVKSWHDITLKPRSRKDINLMKMKREIEKVSKVKKTKNEISIGLINEKTGQKDKQMRDRKVTRKAAQRLWERKQRAAEIGKKASKWPRAHNEKKHFMHKTKIE